MATTRRDYYEVLGVSRAADDAEIKRAFRRLARELHPDVSEAVDSQERFREVVEAYEVLSKREIRVLRGCGMPVLQGFGRGDHRVLVNVAVPRRLTDEQQRLLEEFGRSTDDETYRADEG